MFTIFETLFLLAMDDENGDLVESAVSDLEPALAGAVLAELIMHHRIEVDEGHIIVTDPTMTENPILDHALFSMYETARMRKVKYWINTLIYEKLCSEIGHYLVVKGVLVRKKKRLLPVVPFGIYSNGQVSAKYDLKHRLREIVLAGYQAEKSELIQLALLHNCNLLTLVFTRGERKSAEKKIMNMLPGNGTEKVSSAELNRVIRVATRSLN